MKTIEVKGTERNDLGKKATKALRTEERVPCVVYGGKSNIHFSVAVNDLRNLVYTPHVYIVNLDVDGKKTQALMKEISFHAVTDAVEHIDFLEIADDKKVTISVPVKLKGLAEGVRQGGKMMLNSRYLKVKALPKDLPDTMDIDVTKLALGKTIKVGELNYDNIELLDAKNAVVCAVKLTRSAMAARAAAAAQ